LNVALGKYQPAKSQPILVGGARLLKPALRLLTLYRLRIDEIRDGKAVTSYTRWLEAVQVKDESVSVTLNPRFKRIWLEVKKRLIDSVEQTASPGFASQYAIRFFSWAKKHVGTTRVSVDEIRKVLGLESVKDADGNLIREAPLSLWANFRQRALDLAIGEINKKTDLNIELESIERAKHRRVTGLVFSIKAQSTHSQFPFKLVKPRSAVLRLPDFVEPMKAKLVGSMPVGAWLPRSPR
jgi:plasmid replication initiation protein